MSLGLAGASLNPEQAENFEDVPPPPAERAAFVASQGDCPKLFQMEKQFAVKGPLSVLPDARFVRSQSSWFAD